MTFENINNQSTVCAIINNFQTFSCSNVCKNASGKLLDIPVLH